MTGKKWLRTLAVCVSATLLASATSAIFTGCGKKISNEKTPLTLSSEPLDGVFNPFFYTAGPDGDVVGQTQLGMLASNVKGEMVAGADQPSVALDFSYVTTGTENDVNPGADDEYANYYTDYYFAIKNDVKFSDGTPLTIKDVLFNLYMYLDPAYTGSSTMYSVNIKGLAAYRTQTLDKAQQEEFESYFDTEAETRINAILSWAKDENSRWNTLSGYGEHTEEDILKAHELFKEELQSDWNSAQESVKDYEKYNFTQGWEVFLYNYGSAGGITVTTEKDGQGNTSYKVDYNGTDKLDHSEKAMIDYIYNNMVGEAQSASKAYKDNISAIVSYYATANTLRTYLVSQSITDYFKDKEKTVTTISGITAEKRDSLPAQNGQNKPLGGEYDVLHIRIDGVDPKAIYNFGFSVAPMHYYSSHADEFSLEEGKEYFGVEFGDSDFMTEVKGIQVPLGAGAYRASTENGSKATDKINKSDFNNNNIVYFESNENFVLGAPKIKKLRYKVISTTLLYDAVKNGEVHFAMPTATNEMIVKLEGVDKKALDYTITENLGYGYIGVNATYVNELPIRRAIMHAMDTSLCLDYYGGGQLAELIYRPMSKTLKDYYPSDITEPYYAYDGTGETSLELAQEAGYSLKNGVLTNAAGKKLSFTFTIAGDTTDHPAYKVLNNAANVLNSKGFDIKVTTDSTALSKLSNGQLAVWAAAWSSTSDPDMYQVYHKDSNATSILNWGYSYIEREGTSEEKNLLDELAALIEDGRATDVVAKRQPIYREALDVVMELAIELPTYQRKDLYVYQNGIFDTSTFTEASAYQSPLSELWNVSFAAK